MVNILRHAHSGIRWIVLILLIVAIVNAYTKWKSGKLVSDKDKKINLFTLIFSHIQLLLGLVLYFTSPKVVFAAEAMKNSAQRFFLVEHIAMMIIAIILITIGHSRSKKAATNTSSFKTVFWFYLIALVLILVSIPWPFQSYGASWF